MSKIIKLPILIVKKSFANKLVSVGILLLIYRKDFRNINYNNIPNIKNEISQRFKKQKNYYEFFDNDKLPIKIQIEKPVKKIKLDKKFLSTFLIIFNDFVKNKDLDQTEQSDQKLKEDIINESKNRDETLFFRYNLDDILKEYK